MRDKNQTAVEWLTKILENQKNEPFNFDEWKIAFEHAKEIETKQIIEAHGSKLKKSRDAGNYEFWFNGIDYYNETFKNTENEKV